MQWSVKIDIEVWKADFTKASQDVTKFARDTGKALDPIKNTKLEMDVANATIKLSDLRKQMKDFQWTILQKKQLIIDTNNAQSQLTEAKRKLQNFRNTWDEATSRLQTKFQNLWSSINTSLKWIVSNFSQMFSAVAISGAVLWFVNMVKNAFTSSQDAFVKYQQQISNISTIVEWDMTWISNQLLELSKRVPKSIWDLADWLYDVYSAWITAEDAMTVLEQSAMLASAGLGTTTEAVDLMTSALNAFSKQWYTAEQIATTFFIATRNGKVTVAQLAQWFWWLAGLASTLWVDFQELIAATTAMTTTGLSASEAYTGIQWVLTAVAKQTKQSTDTAKELWIEFNATWLATKWFAWFLEDINKKLKDHWIEWPKAAEVMSNLFWRVEWLNIVLSLWWANLEAFNQAMKDIKENDINVFLEAFDKQNQTVNARLVKLNNELEIERIRLWESTSAFAWFWTYLQWQFIQTLRAVTWTIWILFKWVVLWVVSIYDSFVALKDWVKFVFTNIGSIIWNSFNSVLNWVINLANKWSSLINKILPKDLKIWTIQNVETKYSYKTPATPELFWNTKGQFDKIKNSVNEIFWTKWQITAQAVNTRNNVKKEIDNLWDDTTKNLDKIWWSVEKWKDKRKEYQDEISKVAEEMANMRAEALKDIDDINYKLKELQASWSSDLAKRYAEIVNSLATTTDETEKNALLQEKAFIEWKVTKELLDQAVAYSQLNDAQKIYKDNQQEIADLTERKSIDTALLDSKLVQTKDGWVGIQDENDPTKIIAITNLKNQEYAQDLLNQQNINIQKIEEIQKQADLELWIKDALNQDKLALEQQYTKDFWIEIQKQISLVNSLISAMAKLSKARWSSWGSTGRGGTTNNQNNTINVNNNVDVSTVTNTINSWLH